MESEKEKNSEVLEKEIETKDEIVDLLKSLKLRTNQQRIIPNHFPLISPKILIFQKH